MTFRSLIPFFAAVLGVALLFWSFVAGISAALDGSGNGSLFWQVVFVLAAIAVLGTIVLSIINIVKKRAVVISVATLFVGVLPFIAIIILAVLALQPGPR
jgi:uncharacterized Tic20 family protein